MYYVIEYLKECIKWKILKCFKRNVGRIGSPMDYVMLELISKGYLMGNAKALELFGMYGLWHTMDYLPYIEHLDFFDIEEHYIKYARRTFKDVRNKVDLYCADSVKYIYATKNRYDVVIADTPYGVSSFYDENGLPTFFEGLLNVLKGRGILIFNIHTSNIIKWQLIKSALKKRLAGDREIKDIFVMPRNEMVSYVVIVIDRKGTNGDIRFDDLL